MGLILGSLFSHAPLSFAGLQARFSAVGFSVALLFYNSLDALPVFFLVTSPTPHLTVILLPACRVDCKDGPD